MSLRIAAIAFLLVGRFCLSAAESTAPAAAPSWLDRDKSYPYLDNRPLGSREQPLVLRTFLPNPGLEEAVFANHRLGFKAFAYSPEKGVDLAGTVMPIDGIPAAIAVSYGADLSIVFDTTEGRLLYAWQGGFLDLFPYWGDAVTRGAMVQMDYVPRLIGTLIYRASQAHPLEIDGRSVSELGAPQFAGYDLVKSQPVFLVRHGKFLVRTTLQPAGPLAFRLTFATEPPARLSYRNESNRYTLTQHQAAAGQLSLTVKGASLGEYKGYERAPDLKVASIAAGRQLYQNFGCASCHNLNGAKSNGPTHVGLFGREQTLLDGTKVKVDEAYLLESIKNPNAKIPLGYAPNVMPPYNQLSDLQYQSLILFIKSLLQPEEAL